MFFYWNTGYAKNMTIHDFSFKDIDGNIVNLEKFKGKPIRYEKKNTIVVNC